MTDTTPPTMWMAKKFVIGRVTPKFPNLPEATSLKEINNALLAH